VVKQFANIIIILNVSHMLLVAVALLTAAVINNPHDFALQLEAFTLLCFALLSY
jgi:hypothetical protein